ncbi:hypothetical protein Tco_1109522 [Tanacetum coccineum]
MSSFGCFTMNVYKKHFHQKNQDKKNMLMHIDELHKFSDGTLNDVQSALNDTLKRIRMKYLPQTVWRKVDRERVGAMIHAIDRQLKNRRILRSLEKFVGGRLYGGDLQPEPEGSTQGYPLASVEVLRKSWDPSDAVHKPSLANSSLSPDSCFISHEDYTHFYRLFTLSC